MIEFLVDRSIDSRKRLHRSVPGERFASFVSRVREWMRTNSGYRWSQRYRWARSKINGFRYSEPARHVWSVKYWTIRELTTAAELHEEGNDLHHCVGSYADACGRGLTTIWSMCSHRAMTCNFHESRRVSLRRAAQTPPLKMKAIAHPTNGTSEAPVARWCRSYLLRPPRRKVSLPSPSHM